MKYYISRRKLIYIFDEKAEYYRKNIGFSSNSYIPRLIFKTEREAIQALKSIRNVRKIPSAKNYLVFQDK